MFFISMMLFSAFVLVYGITFCLVKFSLAKSYLFFLLIQCRNNSIVAIALPDVIIGSFLGLNLKASTTQLILGLLIMTTALLFVSSESKYTDLGNNSVEMTAAYRCLWITIPASIGSGMLSTSMSEWLIPIMRSKLSLKMSNAIGTSLCITFLISVLGVISHILMGNQAEIMVVLWAAPGVIIGGQIGSRLTKRINERLLKEAFIFFSLWLEFI